MLTHLNTNLAITLYYVAFLPYFLMLVTALENIGLKYPHDL